MKSSTLEQIASFIKEQDVFVLCGHVDPDPDCLGSIGALSLALQSMGKQVFIVTEPVPPSLEFIPGIEGVLRAHEVSKSAGRIPNAIVLDCDPDRTGEVEEIVELADMVINIDHHATNKGQGDLVYLDTKAAATGEIVYRLLQLLPVKWDDKIANALYAALSGDTGSFKYSNTTERTFAIAGDLVTKGAEPNYIAQEIYERKPLNYVRLVGTALNTLHVSEDGLVAWILLTTDMLEKHSLNSSDAEGLVNYPRMIDGVEVAMMFRQEDGRTKVSFRSRSTIDVSRIARSFGGGGHMRASGCTIFEPLDEVVNRVVSAVNEAVEAAKSEGALAL